MLLRRLVQTVRCHRPRRVLRVVRVHLRYVTLNEMDVRIWSMSDRSVRRRLQVRRNPGALDRYCLVLKVALRVVSSAVQVSVKRCRPEAYRQTGCSPGSATARLRVLRIATDRFVSSRKVAVANRDVRSIDCRGCAVSAVAARRACAEIKRRDSLIVALI